MAHSQPLKCLSVKLVMAGDSWVGKTSILRRYTGDSDPSLISTIGIDFRIKTVTIDETMLKLQIWDTAGQERFHTLSVSYFRGAHGFVLVYDITNSDSFKNVEYWMKDIQKLAWEYGIPFFETSAKNNINIDQAFSVLVEGIFGKKASLQLATNVVTLRERKRKDACCNT
ncbi:ras-related protein Rab-10-like isoform X2 [Rhinatrema bivittatum]|uniref:ras-related protein Rab-10-like isoform X2 n=1 Tax=Rhinatrema bivittatum TaxID=194408 RepID=UPI00112ACBA5|nr:ras-related protein Rab-10-like isoform X2 [Rhinatrema bivittatum]